jgi:hypothetical protein
LTDICLPLVLVGYAALYVVFSHLKKGVFFGAAGFQPEQYLYWIGLAAIAFMWLAWGRRDQPSPPVTEYPETGRRWIALVLCVLILIALMALISISIHDGLPGAHRRF